MFHFILFYFLFYCRFKFTKQKVKKVPDFYQKDYLTTYFYCLYVFKLKKKINSNTILINNDGV